MTSSYRREHEPAPLNDEFVWLSQAARTIINNAAAFYEGQVDTVDTEPPTEAQRRALKRAMARFVIDSGIAKTRGWV